MASFKSMTDVAYDVMSKKKHSMDFSNLWKEVVNTTHIQDEDEAIAQFYTDLTLDGRFASLKDNNWDLKERYSFEETYVDLSELDTDEDEELTEEVEEDEDGEIIKSEEDEEDY